MTDEPKRDRWQPIVSFIGALAVAAVVGYAARVTTAGDATIELRSDLKNLQSQVAAGAATTASGIQSLQASMTRLDDKVQAMADRFVTRAEYERGLQRIELRLDRIEQARPPGR